MKWNVSRGRCVHNFSFLRFSTSDIVLGGKCSRQNYREYRLNEMGYLNGGAEIKNVFYLMERKRTNHPEDISIAIRFLLLGINSKNIYFILWYNYYWCVEPWNRVLRYMFHQPLNWYLPRKVEKHKVVGRCSAYSCMKSSGVHLLPHFHLIHEQTWREDGKQMIFECLSLLFCVFVQHNLREMSLLASGKSPDRPGNTVWEVAGNILTL